MSKVKWQFWQITPLQVKSLAISMNVFAVLEMELRAAKRPFRAYDFILSKNRLFLLTLPGRAPQNILFG